MEWREPDETADSRRGGSLQMEFGLEAVEARELTIELRREERRMCDRSPRRSTCRVESGLSPRPLPFDAFEMKIQPKLGLKWLPMAHAPRHLIEMQDGYAPNDGPLCRDWCRSGD